MSPMSVSGHGFRPPRLSRPPLQLSQLSPARAGLPRCSARAGSLYRLPRRTRGETVQESLLGSRRAAVAIACVVVGALALAGGIAAGRPTSRPARSSTPGPVTSRYALAGRCGAFGAQRLYLKATGLGTYMLYRRDGRLLAGHDQTLIRAKTAGPATEWKAVVKRGQLTFTRPGGPTIGGLAPATGCKPFPEAQGD